MRERDWREILDTQIAHSRVYDRTSRRSTAVNYPQALHLLTLEAARFRDISMAAYQRRAALAFAHFDLRFDWAEAMAEEPPVAPFAGGRAVELRGQGHGNWIIEGLR